MKNILKSTLLTLLIAVSVSAYSQKGKFAHIDSNELLAAMPERAELEKKLTSESLKCGPLKYFRVSGFLTLE